jgi:integrase
MEKYAYVLRDQFKPWWMRQGDKPAATFRAESYLAFKKKLADDDGLQPKTVADRLMIVRRLFTWAATKCDPPLLSKYPLANVALPKVPEKQQQPCFTPEQVCMILDNATAAERPIYATFAFTGMRFGELRDLQWSDIDLRDGRRTIYVRRGGSRKDMTKPHQREGLDRVSDAWVGGREL